MTLHLRCLVVLISGLSLSAAQVAAQQYPAYPNGGYPNAGGYGYPTGNYTGTGVAGEHIPPQTHYPQAPQSVQQWPHPSASTQGTGVPNAPQNSVVNGPSRWPQPYPAQAPNRPLRPGEGQVVRGPSYAFPPAYATQAPGFPPANAPAVTAPPRYPLGQSLLTQSDVSTGYGIPALNAGYGAGQAPVTPPPPQSILRPGQNPLPAPQLQPGVRQRGPVNPGEYNGGFQAQNPGQNSYSDPYLGAMPGYGNSNVYDETSACGECGLAECCGGCGCSITCYGGAAALFLFRDYESRIPLQTSTTTPDVTRLDTRDAGVGFLPGVEVTFGQVFCCCWGWQFSAWGAWAAAEDSFSDNNQQTLVTTFSDSDFYPQGFVNQTSEDFFNSNTTVRIRRENEIYNAEFSLFRLGCITPNPCGPQVCCDPCDPCCNPCCPPKSYGGTLFGGFRYLAFRENFTLSSLVNPNVPSNQDLHYEVGIRNFLIGPQVGGVFSCNCGCRCSLMGSLKFGVYLNHIEHRQRIGGSDDTAVINSGPFAGTEYNFISEKDDAAGMAEASVGLGCQITRHTRIVGGYRIIGISGVALAPGQFPRNATYVPGIIQIDSSSSLILHGAFVGAEISF